MKKREAPYKCQCEDLEYIMCLRHQNANWPSHSQTVIEDHHRGFLQVKGHLMLMTL